MKTQVVNIRREKCDVKICRKRDNTIPPPPEEGCFGNPFYLKDPDNDREREIVINNYRAYFYNLIEHSPAFKDAVLSLKGKRLGCFCAPKPCHGDVIVEYLAADDEGDSNELA